MLLLLTLAAAIAIPPTGRVVLPRGIVTVAAEIVIPPSAHDLTITGHPRGTTLRLARAFRGRGAIVIDRARNIRLTNIAIDGDRDARPKRVGLPPSNVTFASFYRNNGVVVLNASNTVIHRLTFRRIWGFAVLATASKKVSVTQSEIRDSGSRNEKGRNNTTGGILFEEGTEDFEVLDSRFLHVLGNGVWTHSNYGSPRNKRGLFARNELHEIGRDALQAGHATEVRIADNFGARVGYPADAVDIENGAFPVVVDTAGDVDRSVYSGNKFEETNGKCVDLDGFHHGEVVSNTCVNRGGAADYPHGHMGIVVNNSNPDMTSTGIVIRDNTIVGFKYGGLFLMGRGHTVEKNRFLDLNLAHCNENAALYHCTAIPGEPDVLRAGIYLGRIASPTHEHRADASRDHVIRDNVITGFKMGERCIMAAPGVELSRSTIINNRCEDGGR